MSLAQTVIVILGCVCLLLATINKPSNPPLQLGWLGLLLFTIAYLLGAR